MIFLGSNQKSATALMYTESQTYRGRQVLLNSNILCINIISPGAGIPICQTIEPINLAAGFSGLLLLKMAIDI